MSLPDVLLSLLREPMSGTDLIRLFRGTIHHFWSTDLSQVYRALEALEREGCVRARSVPSNRGPARKVYRLAASGRRRLAAWIRRRPRIPPVKLEYLAQLFSVTADERPRQRARELLTSMREEAARGVAVLEAIDAHARDVPGYPDAMPGNVFYPLLTLQHGLLRRRALLQWIDECLARVQRRPEAADEEPSAGTLAELVEMLQLVGEEAGAPAADPVGRDEEGEDDA